MLEKLLLIYQNNVNYDIVIHVYQLVMLIDCFPYCSKHLLFKLNCVWYIYVCVCVFYVILQFMCFMHVL